MRPCDRKVIILALLGTGITFIIFLLWSSHRDKHKQIVASEYGKSHLRGIVKNAKTSVCGITSFFNPAKFKSKSTNYKRFAQRVRTQGLFLITVELAFDEQEYQISGSGADIIVRRRVPLDAGAMWQKERLLNLGIEVAPEWCANIIVLDCDILFLNNMWIARTLEALQTSLIVQPFSISYRMTEKDLATDLPSDSATETMFSHTHAVGMGEGQIMHGAVMGTAAILCMHDGSLAQACNDTRAHRNQIFSSLHVPRGNTAKTLLDWNSNIRGHPGYAWAFRRSTISLIGGSSALFDKMVFGGGDDILAKAFIGVGSPSKLPVFLAESVAEYTTSVREVIQSQVDFVPGLIAHLPHGLVGNRGYALRSLIMRKSNFDPRKQLCQCSDCEQSDTRDRRGVWLWCSSRKGRLQWQRSLKSYFKSRREDELGSDTRPKQQASDDSTCGQGTPESTCVWLVRIRNWYAQRSFPW